MSVFLLPHLATGCSHARGSEVAIRDASAEEIHALTLDYQ
jgi:hypothetical protein